MDTNLTTDSRSSLASSSPFPDVYSDRRFLPISLYTPPTNFSAVFGASMNELDFNFTDITLNNHPTLADSDEYQEYQRFISAYGSQPHNLETQSSLPLYAPVPSRPAFMSPDSIYSEPPPDLDGIYTPDGHYNECEISPTASSTVYDELEDSSESISELFRDKDSSFVPTFPTPSELLAELAEKGLSAPADEFSTEGRPESASKARRRAMAESVGFLPTDPDSISSHEKKRHYLATLEQYVMFLSEQLQLAGLAPDPMVPVPSCRGLSSLSTRILLVHMANVARKLNQVTLANEEKFLALSEEVARREEARIEFSVGMH